MDEDQRSLLIRAFSHYSSSPGLELRYGVQGFVGEESVLRSVCCRIGILAALRSMKLKSVTGVVIMACGGSVKKNGVRIVDPDGGALIADWERLADSVANAIDPDEFVTLIEELAEKENISFENGQSAEVLLARDTSPSGEALLEAAKQGISSVAGTVVHDMGVLTSPQLHWLVHARNKGRNASEHDYLLHLSYSYRCLVDSIPEGTTTDKVGESLIVDGANSVCGDKIEALKDLCDGLAIEMRNTSKGCAIIDQGVGFDFVQEQKTVPSGFGSSDIGFRCASLDRNGDRLLYFSVLPSQEIELVDGDKILFLFALFIKEQLTVLQELETEKEVHYDARIAILQSVNAYRESKNYLKSLGLDIVSFTPGTRSLHAVASQYDIGIYFEPDGSVGILFSKNYLIWLEDKNIELLSSSKGSRKQLTVSRLLAVSRMMNTTVPDALASLLMVEAILQYNGWSLQKWNENYYDVANRQHSEVELAEKIPGAIDNSKTEEEDDLIDEARSENANVSDLSQESNNIDQASTESAEQAMIHTGDQIDVDASVELGQNRDQGTTTHFQACENGTHAESQSVPLHNDETSDTIKLEEDPQVHCVIKSPPEEHEFAAEEAEDAEDVNDKEVTEIKREVDDDTWVLVSDCLNPELGGPLNEKESYPSPQSNGITIIESDFDAQTQSHIKSSLHSPELNDSSNEKESPVENVDALLVLAEAEGGGVINGLESASNEPSNERGSCSIPKVNGIHTQSENDDLVVSFDTERAETGDNIGPESACDAQPQPSVILQDEQLETKAQNGSVDVHNGLNRPVDNGQLDGNDINVPMDSGEETEDPVVEYASCTKAPFEVNGVVATLNPCEHLATDNSPINIDSNDLVNGKNSDTGINISSSEVCSVEPSMDTLNNLPIPSDLDDTDKVGSINDDIGVKSPSHIPWAISCIDHDRKLDSQAENGGCDLENGDANLAVDNAIELCNLSDIVQIETSVDDGSGTVKVDSEVNGGISSTLPVVEITEPEIKSENDPAEVESKSESTTDNVETVETEVGNEFQTVPDNQPPSNINRGLETEAEINSPLDDALETETITADDGSHDAQETYLESNVQNSLLSGEGTSDCLVANSSNWQITIGSMQCVCPKSETPLMESREVCHDDSTASNIEVTVPFNESYSQKVEDKDGDVNGSSEVNEAVRAVETNLDEESTSSVKESATAIVDGQSNSDEIVKKPFYYLIRIPKYDDEKLSEQIRLAEMLLEEKTLDRDAALAEYRHKKENCQTLGANQQAAILEERAVRDLVRAKRKEIDSAQSLVNIAKDAMTIEDLDNKIANMEHTIQHETVSLNEEKKLIREIKQSAKMREQLLATTKNQGVQQALNHKDKNEDHVKTLRKELDALRISLSEAEHAVTAAMKILDTEHAMLNELHRKLTLSNDVRQEAYSNLQNLRSQWSEKNKYFWSCKNAQRQANNYAASGDKTSLQSVCVDQVESVMKLWNLEDEFRRDYLRCNSRSTLRRLGTADGRSLGPDEEPPRPIIPPARRINSSLKGKKESINPEAVVKATKVKVVEQKKPDVVVLNKPKKVSTVKKEEEEVSNSIKVEEEKEDLKALKEKEELAKKEEELRKIEEAVKLKERRRLEEKAKFQEALERKRRQAEKAQAKAELRLRRQAEEKEKEKEKRAMKKKNKTGRLSDDATSIPETETATTPVSEQPKEAETREKSVTSIKKSQHYAKQNKLKTILPPPPPLRNRGKRRTQQWMWVAATIAAILVLFFLGNLNLPEIGGVLGALSSWY